MNVRQSIRIFNHPLLERLTHVHPITPLLMWVPIAFAFSWFSLTSDQVGWPLFLSLFVVGVISWSLVEYLLHRFVFHFPAQSPLMKRFVFVMHGLHHDDPRDTTRLVMPPAGSIIIGTVLYTVLVISMGPVLTKPSFVGLLVGYLAYDYTHFWVHRFNPKTRVGRYLKQYHMDHHFIDDHTRWGVSSPLWDIVFGTFKSVKKRG